MAPGNKRLSREALSLYIAWSQVHTFQTKGWLYFSLTIHNMAEAILNQYTEQLSAEIGLEDRTPGKSRKVALVSSQKAVLL